MDMALRAMNMIGDIYRKISLWGIKGIVGALKSRLSAALLERRLLADARRHPLSPQAGFTVIADFSQRLALMKTMRDVVIALKRAGIPYQTFNLGPDNELSSDPRFFTPRKDFRILKYSHSLEMLKSIIPEELPIRRNVICFWEFDSGLMDSYIFLRKAENIVAMSDFNYDYYRREFSNDVNVKKLLYPFRFPDFAIEPRSETRKRYNLSEQDFIVFYNVGIGSARKNPDGCVSAFANAFRDVGDAKLLLKISLSDTFKYEFQKLKDHIAELGIGNQVVIVTEHLSDSEIMNITNAIDVYFSPHRGEGFGLGMAEAMCMGKCVVATGWSAPTEFLKNNNAILLPYRLQPIKPSKFDRTVYFGVTKWAEPDLGCAAEALRRLYDDRGLCSELGCRSRVFVEEYFSISQFRRSAESLLKDEP